MGIVPQVVPIHAPVFRDQAHDHQVVPGGLAHLDALALHHLRQARHGELELVLHLGPGQIRIGPRGKGQLDAGRAGRIAGGGQIQHLVEAGHLLLDDLRHAVFHRLRRGPRIKGGDGDGRRRDGRILRDGQVVDRQAARHHQDDGDDPGEDRTVQEESR